MTPGRAAREIVTDVDNFPTDRYVLEGLAAERGLEILWVRADPAAGPEPAHVAELIVRAHGAGDLLPRQLPLGLHPRRADDHARSRMTMARWPCGTSATARGHPGEPRRHGVDLAVGCTYKYLNGGPGAPAYLYVRAEHQDALRQPIWGWLGRRDPFEMAPGYHPGEGIRRMLSGTPPVLALTAVAAGLELVVEAGIDAIRAKSIGLTEFAIALIDDWLATAGSRVASPRAASRRGSHVALAHPEARTLSRSSSRAASSSDFRIRTSSASGSRR